MRYTELSLLRVWAVMAICISLGLKYTYQTETPPADNTSDMTSTSFVISSGDSTEATADNASFVFTGESKETTPSLMVPNETTFRFTLDCENLSNVTMLHTNATLNSECSDNINTTAQVHTKTSIEILEEITEFNVYLFVYHNGVFITSAPGLITNPMCIIVSLSVKPFKTSELYMLTLGICDWIVVVMRLVIRQMDSYNIYQSQFVCTLTYFIVNLTLAYSNLILMTWTLERFIAVVFPLKLASWCTLRNTGIVLSLVFVIVFALTIAYLYAVKQMTYFNGDEMIHGCYYNDFFYKSWAHIETIYYLYIPMVVICGCNFVILKKIRAMSKARINMASDQSIVDKRTKEQRQMTIMLVTISAAFVFLHIPMSLAVVFGYLYDATELYFISPKFYAQFAMYMFIGYSITEMQNSINFFLYCLTGTKFRLVFIRIFCRCRAQPKPVTSVMTSTTGVKSISESVTN